MDDGHLSTSQINKKKKKKKTWSSVFFFGRIFATWRKKKGLANPTKGFLRFFFKNRHILTKKT
jgi:hypothetical protein